MKRLLEALGPMPNDMAVAICLEALKAIKFGYHKGDIDSQCFEVQVVLKAIESI